MSSPDSYGFGSRLLHQFALSSRYLREVAFDLESSAYLARAIDHSDKKHVFVCGLARAGTTLLLRVLHDAGELKSLTYRDMPFVVAPNYWHKLSGASVKSQELSERAHGDGIMVNFDSPEAFEEVFWATFHGSDYLRSDRLVPMTTGDSGIQRFRDYVNLVLLRYDGSRYLSKNNNSILRLPVLRAAFPNCALLIPFRDPVAHATSLLKQHQRFCSQRNGFVEKYMEWLGHHEFGPGHRPFVLGGDVNINTAESGSLDYWLQRWIDVYGWLRAREGTNPSGALFFCYEDLCRNSVSVEAGLRERLDLPDLEINHAEIRPVSDLPDPECGTELLDRAKALYTELSVISQSNFGNV